MPLSTDNAYFTNPLECYVHILLSVPCESAQDEELAHSLKVVMIRNANQILLTALQTL